MKNNFLASDEKKQSMLIAAFT